MKQVKDINITRFLKLKSLPCLMEFKRLSNKLFICKTVKIYQFISFQFNGSKNILFLLKTLVLPVLRRISNVCWLIQVVLYRK